MFPVSAQNWNKLIPVMDETMRPAAEIAKLARISLPAALSGLSYGMGVGLVYCAYTAHRSTLPPRGRYRLA